MQIMSMLRTSDITSKYCTDAMFVIADTQKNPFHSSGVGFSTIFETPSFNGPLSYIT
jgi:hypothetical protein